MGAIIPRAVAESGLSRTLAEAGLTRIHQGKVRDTWRLPTFINLLLIVATDRISIFDFVLSALVKGKGEVLTAMTIFWLNWLEKKLNGFRHHIVAYGAGIDDYLPFSLAGNLDLRKRAMVVRRLDIIPVEYVVRGFLTGSGWRDYQDTGKVFGIEMPEGLFDGAQLPKFLFTPTTKAEDGHDLPMDPDEAVREYGTRPRDLALAIYNLARGYALEKGIILADTKFEFGGRTLADEVLTPDSSRFWLRDDWQKAVEKRQPPAGFDKEVVRNHGKTIVTPFAKDGKPIVGLHRLDADDPEHVAFVHGLTLPDDLLQETGRRYRFIFSKLAPRSWRRSKRWK